MTETNGIAYEIDPTRQERIYFPEFRNKIFYCMYAGNISPTERLYIDTNDNNRQYIKTLEPIDDTLYVGFGDSKDVICSNTLPVYPVFIETTCEPGVYYTNSNGDTFYRKFFPKEEEYKDISLRYSDSYQSFLGPDQCCPHTDMLLISGFFHIGETCRERTQQFN